MVTDPDAACLALKARDARFDGRLFVGVTSTGVYCCFFASAALAQAAARAIERAVHAGEPVDLAVLAGRLGVTDRHLRRIFQAFQVARRGGPCSGDKIHPRPPIPGVDSAVPAKLQSPLPARVPACRERAECDVGSTGCWPVSDWRPGWPRPSSRSRSWSRPTAA